MKKILFTALLALASICWGQNIQLKTNLNLPSTGRHAASVNQKAAVGSSVQGPSVSLSCTAPTSGVVPNSYNFYRSTTTGTGYVIVGSSATCSYTDTTVLWDDVLLRGDFRQHCDVPLWECLRKRRFQSGKCNYWCKPCSESSNGADRGNYCEQQYSPSMECPDSPAGSDRECIHCMAWRESIPTFAFKDCDGHRDGLHRQRM